jgi:hypothetical protein
VQLLAVTGQLLPVRLLQVSTSVQLLPVSTSMPGSVQRVKTLTHKALTHNASRLKADADSQFKSD